MYIYKRFTRFQGHPIDASPPSHRSSSSFFLPHKRVNAGRGIDSSNSSGYKTKQLKTIRNIKNRSAAALGSSVKKQNKKLKRLTKKNTEFLTELGYKVRKKN